MDERSLNIPKRWLQVKQVKSLIIARFQMFQIQAAPDDRIIFKIVTKPSINLINAVIMLIADLLLPPV